MKRLYYAALTLILAASCKVVEYYEPNPMTDANISRLSYNIFQESTDLCLSTFYKAYHIDRFLQADAEEKVSAKYDHIRIGLTKANETYVYDYDEYVFSKEWLSEKGGSCQVNINYHNKLTIRNIGEGTWQINDNNGIAYTVSLIEKKDEAMKMAVGVTGKKTESSDFWAEVSDEGLEATFEYKTIGELDAITCDGAVLVEYYEGSTYIKSCRMTFKPGLTTTFDVF